MTRLFNAKISNTVDTLCNPPAFHWLEFILQSVYGSIEGKGKIEKKDRCARTRGRNRETGG